MDMKTVGSTVDIMLKISSTQVKTNLIHLLHLILRRCHLLMNHIIRIRYIMAFLSQIVEPKDTCKHAKPF